MPHPLTNCIYCSKPFDPSRGQGDHIIPSALGEFRGDVRFRRICPSCNVRIGQCEQQMVRAGPESFFRSIIRPAAPPSRDRGRPGTGAAMGAPAPTFKLLRGDHSTAIEPCPDNALDAVPVDQIVACHPASGEERVIRLYPEMTADGLRKRMAKVGIVSLKPAWLHASDKLFDRYVRLVREVDPTIKFGDMSELEAGRHRLPVRVTMVVGVPYWRAIAKMAFHYYLSHSRRGYRGDEPCFAAIRGFIMEGGDMEQFFHSSGRNVQLPFGQVRAGGAATPNRWCHVFAADESSEAAVAFVNLFLGPGCLTPAHYVTLGSVPSPIVVPSFAWGHTYVYDEHQPQKGSAGQVAEAAVTLTRAC